MTVPLIGISGGVLDNAGPTPGNHRSYVNEAYVTAVSANGGLPVIVPLSYQTDQVHDLVARLDGLILSGGQDVDPAFYSADPHQGLGETWPTRDRFELALLAAAKELGKPVLAICRGFQLVNVAAGGTLYQDLSEIPGQPLQHMHYRHPYEPVHRLKLTADSELNRIFGNDSLMVNSMHHQAVQTVGTGLTPVATAPDGIVEALEDPAHHLIAVQWHPEAMRDHDPLMDRLFAHLITTAGGNIHD